MMVDLRSDTVTKPSEAMRRMMAAALVGDDVYGEDPTVNELEQLMAKELGQEAGLFVPSGTMANQIAILAHTERGDEIFIHRDSHAYYYEGGAAAMWASATWTLLDGKEGLIDAKTLAHVIRPQNIHFPRPRLLILENTHNRSGGAAHAYGSYAPTLEIARSKGLAIHLDGARLYNAAVALRTSVGALTEGIDSVSVCLSKGLGAPVGSVLVGSQEFIERSRQYRKWLGGGMRQAGILAAAGIYALSHNVERLAEDHRRLGRLAEGLMALGLTVRLPDVPTNMVMVDVSDSAEKFLEKLFARGIVAGAMGPHTIRLVTHLDVTDDQVAEAIVAFGEVLDGR